VRVVAAGASKREEWAHTNANNYATQQQGESHAVTTPL